MRIAKLLKTLLIVGIVILMSLGIAYSIYFVTQERAIAGENAGDTQGGTTGGTENKEPGNTQGGTTGGADKTDNPQPPSDNQNGDKDEEQYYEINLDVLGDGSLSMLDISCPQKAKAGERVNFTVVLKPEFSSKYKISRIVLLLGTGDEYIDQITFKDDSYSFNMPNRIIMEDSENEGGVIILFYIVYWDA